MEEGLAASTYLYFTNFQCSNTKGGQSASTKPFYTNNIEYSDMEGGQAASTYSSSSSSTPDDLTSYPLQLVTNSLVLGLGLSLLVVLFSAAGLAVLR